MGPISRMNQVIMLSVASFGLLGHGMNTSADAPAKEACTAPEYRQFDFWAGDWDAFDTDNPKTAVARVRVDRILDGCVLLEDYRGTNGSHGESFSIYDAGTKRWRQSWVTNRGIVLQIDGGLQNGAMILAGSQFTRENAEKRVRGTRSSLDGNVREVGVTSTDGGKNWDPWFDLMFRPARDSRADTIAADKAAIAALDTQYQAAVKNNDAVTMERFLDDDFILVTGSGKTYSKADLLEEARSKRYVYEHQEDTDQTVRIWGDTAVITAKLWAQGTKAGTPFDYHVWFSDTYVRRSAGWKYVFGQSSGPLSRTQQ
jgi:ketosteroid isomerase-like protein